MGLGRYLSSLTKPELEDLKENLNLTDDEEIVFEELRRGRSGVSISEKCNVSTSTVSNRIKAIQRKIFTYKGGGLNDRH